MTVYISGRALFNNNMSRLTAFFFIFPCEYSHVSSLLTIRSKIVELNTNLLYCVVQSSFHVHDSPRFLLLTLELKGLFLIHVHNYESGSHQY